MIKRNYLNTLYIDLAATKITIVSCRYIMWTMISFKWWFSLAVRYLSAVRFAGGFFLKHFSMLRDNG